MTAPVRAASSRHTGAVDVWLRAVAIPPGTASGRLTALTVRDDDVLLLDAVERRRHERFGQAAEAAVYAAHHALARRVVAQALGVEPAEVGFERTCPRCGDQHGRPAVVGHRELSLSLSRSGTVVAVALAEGVAVGVDVERDAATRFGSFPDVALHPRERRRVEGAALGRGRRRARSWARKEAALKALGVGLDVDPASFVTPAARRLVRPVPGLASVRVHDVVATRGHVAAVAGADAAFAVRRH